MKQTLTLSILSFLATLQFAFAAGPVSKHVTHPLYPTKQPDKSLATQPDKATLLEPTYKAKVAQNPVVLKWAPVENATSYRIQIATDPNFKWVVSEVLSQEGTTLEVNELEKGKEYFWRVAGVKRGNDPTYMQGHFVWSAFTVE